jgi:Ser/Thr protein kinase RdoA (MazF antagonist)
VNTPDVDLVAELVRREYGNRVVRCDVLQRNLHDTYAIHAGPGRYVFRLYDSERNEPHLRYELELLRHVGGLASQPISRLNGPDIIRVDTGSGERLGALFTYADGMLMTPRTQTVQTAAAYGNAVARLHDRMDDFSRTDGQGSLDQQVLLGDALESIGEHLGSRDDASFVRRIADHMADWLQRQRGDLIQGVCHGDLQGGNAVLADDGAVCFFDFERCGVGWRAYEVATFRWGAAMGKFRLGWPDQTVHSLWAAYLEGYTQHRRLSPGDLAATDMFVALRHIWYIGLEAKYAHRWSQPVVDDTFWNRELNFLRDWVGRRLSGWS